MYRLEPFEKELKATCKGRDILNLIDQHFEEIMKLVNHNRNVMLVWQRNKGPIFFADIMESGFNHDVVIKTKINGINIESMIRRMAVVLQDYGSYNLKRGIDKYFLLIIEYAKTCKSLNEIFQRLRNNE